MYAGRCHCNAVTLELASSRAAEALPIRICGCSFCTKHRPRYTSDPQGHVTIRAERAEDVVRYRFGLRLADFLLCKTCGVFVAAFAPGPPARAVINSAVLDRAAELVAEPTRFGDYDTEDAPTREARRARTWTPATLLVAGRQES